jgi:hypothetical protein
MRGGGVELGSGDLSDQACSRRQEAPHSLRMVSLGRVTLKLTLSQATENVEGKE